MTTPMSVATIQFHGIEVDVLPGVSAPPSRATASADPLEPSPATVVGTRIGSVVGLALLAVVVEDAWKFGRNGRYGLHRPDGFGDDGDAEGAAVAGAWYHAQVGYGSDGEGPDGEGPDGEGPDGEGPDGYGSDGGG